MSSNTRQIDTSSAQRTSSQSPSYPHGRQLVSRQQPGLPSPSLPLPASRTQTPTSRYSSPATQSTASARFTNSPSIASPLPKEFVDRWLVVDTSLAPGNSSLDAVTTIESSQNGLKRKFKAITQDYSSAASKADSSHSPADSSIVSMIPSPNSLVDVSSGYLEVPPPNKSEPLPNQSILDNAGGIRSAAATPMPFHNLSPIVFLDCANRTIDSPLKGDGTAEDGPLNKPTWSLSNGRTTGTASSPAVNGTNPSELELSNDSSVEQHSSIESKGPYNSSASTSVFAGRPSSEQGPGPNQHIDSNKPLPPDDSTSDFDSDCFEEYDPFDDVSELREALEKHEKILEDRSQLASRTNSQYSPPKMPIKNNKVDLSRRPYLSIEARQHLRDTDISSLPNIDSLVGSRLHVSFSEREAKRVWLSVYVVCLVHMKAGFSIKGSVETLRNILSSSNLTREEKHALLVSLASDAAPKLPGRDEGDVSRYIADVIGSRTDPLSNIEEIRIEPDQSYEEEPYWRHLLLSRQLADGRTLKGLPLSHAQSQSIGYRKSLRFLQPFRTFTEGSSDVVDCAWDPNGHTFALACTTYNDMYNRAGNLMIGSVDGSIKFLCGHKTLRPPNQGNSAILDPYLHSTVTSVELSNGLLFSSSFDQTVKIWDTEQKSLRKSLAFQSPIVRMKMSGSIPGTGAICLQDGRVVVFRPCLDSTDGPDTFGIFESKQDYLEPACVLWANGSGRNSWLFVGYDNKESDKRQLNAHLGDLKLYDVEKGVELAPIRPGSTRQFDISMDESCTFLVAGAIAGPARGPTPDTHSHVRVYDIRDSVRKTMEFSCRHRDINKVTISPCHTYVTSSGTDGKSYLWDTRRGSEPLHELGHGESRTPLSPDRDREEVDTGVTFASWVADGGLLVTGGSDGLVKVWDPAKSDPFLYDLATFNDPVMSGAFSPDGDCLIIGETTGKATLLSYMGRHGPPEPFVQDRSMLAPIASEAEE